MPWRNSLYGNALQWDGILILTLITAIELCVTISVWYAVNTGNIYMLTRHHYHMHVTALSGQRL